jgi:hypothetical protein
MNPIESCVLELLQDIKGEKLELADLDKDLTRDLKITSDDLSFVFALGLERKLGIKVPIDAWRDVHCGRDAVRLFERLGRVERR